MKGYFLAIGELLADVISVEYCDSLEKANAFHLVQGGSPANVAANINYLGGEVKLVSCVGNDGIGKFLLNALEKSGVSSDNIEVSKKEPTSIVMVSKSKGTPDFIAYRHADACIEPVNDLLLDGAVIVHSTAFALSKQPAQGSIFNAMEKAYALGKTVSLDWNFASQIWGVDNGREVFERMMKLEPLLKISIDDLERFTGKTLSIEECKNFLESYYTKTTCLTCGKDGVWFKEKKAPWQFKEAIPVAQVVDVTGAGDAFLGGFIFSFMKGANVAACVENGLETAAKKIKKRTIV